MSARQAGIVRPVATFALSGLAVLALVAVAGALALRSLSTSEAIRDARRVTALTGRGIVQPALTTGVVRGNRGALARLDQIVHGRVLAPDVARVKVWNAEGKILYSDESRLIGRRFPLVRTNCRRCATGRRPPRQPISRAPRTPTNGDSET